MKNTPLDAILSAVVILALTGATPQAFGQSNLVVWDLYGRFSLGSASTNYVANGIQATSITPGPSIGAVGGVDSALAAWSFTMTSAANAKANGDYFEFTVSPAVNYSLSFSALNNNLFRTNGGPTNAAWYWSRDNYATALASTNSVSTSAGGAALNFSLSTNGITDATTFRLAGWNSSNSSSSGILAIIASASASQNPALLGEAVLRATSSLAWGGGLGNGSWAAYDATNATKANWGGNITPINGDTLVFAGTTQTNTTNDVTSLLANAVVFSNNAGTFTISGNTLTVSNGITNLSANGQTFSNQVTLGAAQTFNASAGNLTFAGTIDNNGNRLTVDGISNTAVSGAISGVGGLTKSGTGTLTLSGANSYSGGTVVSAGLLVGDTRSLQGTITNNAAVAFDQTTNGTYAGAMSGSGYLVKTNSGEVTLSGANSYSGGTLVAGGKLIGSTTSLQGAITNNATLAFDQTTNGTFGGTVGGTGVMTKTGAGTVTLTAANTPGGGTLISSGALQIGNNGTSGSLSGLITNNAALVFNRSDNITQSTAISGTGTVIKSGSGTLTLAGTHSYSGGTVVSSGLLVSDTRSLQGAVTNNAALAFDQTTNGIFGGTVSGTGVMTKSGSGTVTLTAANTPGGTLISAGALQIGNNGTSGSLSGLITNNAALVFNRSDNITQSTAISGSGTVIKSGSGTLTLAGTHTYSGGTVVSSGLLVGDTTSLQGAITNNAALAFDQATNGTYAGAMSGSGSLLKTNSGEVTLSGANSYGGGTLVAGGKLIGTTTSLQGAITNNATVTFDQATNGAYAGGMSGSGSLVKTSSGELTLSGANSYGGGTLLNGGWLIAGHTDAFGTGSITVGSGTTLNLTNFTVGNLIVNNGGTILSTGQVSDLVATNGTTYVGGNNSTITEVGGSATMNVSGSAVTVTTASGGTLNVSGSNATVTTLSGGTVNANAAGLVVTNFNGGNIAVSNGVTVALRGGSSSGVISGSGGIAKQGAGTLALSGDSTYSGATAVEEGTLVVDGSVNNSTVTVENGATLGGSGSVGGLHINLGGTISPGNSPGTLSVATNSVWNPGGNYNWQIYDATGTAGNLNGWDLINIAGSLDLTGLSVGNEFNINLWSLSGVAPDVNGNAVNFTAPTDNTWRYTWTILTAAGGITGFDATNFNLNVAAVNGTGGFQNPLGRGTFYLEQNGNDLNLHFGIVPEPGTWAAAALLAGGAAFVRWRKRRA